MTEDYWISVIASLTLSAYLARVKPCNCPLHQADAKAVKDPDNWNLYYAQALLAQSDKDPGQVIADVVEKLGLNSSDMKEIYRTVKNPSDPAEIIAAILRFDEKKYQKMSQIRTTHEQDRSIN